MKRKLVWNATVKRNDRTGDKQKNRSQSDKEAEDEMVKIWLKEISLLLIDTNIIKTRILWTLN